MNRKLIAGGLLTLLCLAKQQTFARIAYWRALRDRRDDEACFVRWVTSVLQILRPLRL